MSERYMEKNGWSPITWSDYHYFVRRFKVYGAGSSPPVTVRVVSISKSKVKNRRVFALFDGEINRFPKKSKDITEILNRIRIG